MNQYIIEVYVDIEDSGRDISSQLDRWMIEKFESPINIHGFELATHLVDSNVKNLGLVIGRIPAELLAPYKEEE